MKRPTFGALKTASYSLKTALGNDKVVSTNGVIISAITE